MYFSSPALPPGAPGPRRERVAPRERERAAAPHLGSRPRGGRSGRGGGSRGRGGVCGRGAPMADDWDPFADPGAAAAPAPAPKPAAAAAVADGEGGGIASLEKEDIDEISDEVMRRLKAEPQMTLKD